MQPAKKPSKSKRQSRKKAATPRLDLSDKHVLYENSVQDTEADIVFIDRVYKQAFKRRPVRLREDFCGTAMLCANWVQKLGERSAVGLDLHQPTMAWGTEHHLKPLGARAARVELLRRNVLDGLADDCAPVDVTVAFNFSYCCLRERQTLLTYMKGVKAGLSQDGMFIMDIHGGPESFEELEETTRHKEGFTYVWDQGPYDPITGFAKRAIHFRFARGPDMHNAFTYAWRLWTLPEVTDILHEAGFSRVDVYWEGTDEDGEGNGVFKKVRHAEDELSWIAYVVALP